MNRINKSNVMMLMAAVLFLFASCHRELDVAPVATYDVKATHTIAQLLTYHVPGSTDSFDTLPQGMVIEGTVISSDKEGNCYKYITIDDGTAGIQVKINSSTLYPNYPLGQHLYIKCDELVLGDYHKQLQLGWWENDGMQGISTNKLYKYVFIDGIPGPNPEPAIELTSANQIQDDMYNRLVRLKNVHFSEPGQLYASGASAAEQSRIILFEDGTNITLYTSYFATFASEVTPAGVFDMVAILGRYNSTKQVIIRSLQDIGTPVVPTTYTEVVVNAMDLSQNPLDNGWTNQVVAGSSWEYMSGNSMRIEGSASSNDSWLVSPSINANGYDNLQVSFSHRSPTGSANRQVYYSTNYTGGNVNDAVWIPLNVNDYATTYTTYTQALPDELLSASNLKFAFRYQDNTNSMWMVKDFKVISIVEQ